MSNSNSSDALAVLFAGGVSVLFIIFWILYAIILIAIVTILIISMWKLFVKAGQPGWASIVPIYNFWVLCDMVFNNNIMWFIFIFIPFLNFVSMIAMMIGMAKTFGKGTGFAILTIFFYIVTFPILAFGKATYDPTKKIC